MTCLASGSPVRLRYRDDVPNGRRSVGSMVMAEGGWLDCRYRSRTQTCQRVSPIVPSRSPDRLPTVG
jgi:hypothetical protein